MNSLHHRGSQAQAQAQAQAGAQTLTQTLTQMQAPTRAQTNSRTRSGALACLTLLCAAAAQAQPPNIRIDAAVLDAQRRLAMPPDAERWIVVGASIGGEYSEAPFDPENPGVIGVVQMEPAAYDYFLANGEYADGTMFLLSFYRPQEKPEPELPGFVQGPLMQQEIHLIDRQGFPDEGRAFYVYAPEASAPSAPLPPGSNCVVCHMEHGDFDGTFTQFYPRLREHFADLTN